MCLSIVFVAEVDGFCCLLCIGRVFWNNSALGLKPLPGFGV